MAKIKTQAEIKAEIAGLERMRKALPEYSKLGDKNWEKIDAQIAVLKGESDPDDFYMDEHSEDFTDGDNDVWSEADRAERWMLGEESESLCEGY